MAAVPRSVAEIRTALRRCLAPRPRGELVMVACSGGPDSLVLAATAAFLAPRLGLRAGGATVDHGLHAESAAQAARTAEAMRELGLDPVDVRRVTVSGPGGMEAAARRARYDALDEAAAAHRAGTVLLGHTRDDQAETVLLGLVRGSGTRSLAGMAPERGIYRRPMLGVPRATVHAAVAELGLHPWQDPHNSDPALLRSRLRHDVLPALEESLGPGVAAALARSAEQSRADTEALDGYAREAYAAARADQGGLTVAALAALPRAVRTRVLRMHALDRGVPGGSLSSVHIGELDGLVTRWRGQGAVALPGDLRGTRLGDRVVIH